MSMTMADKERRCIRGKYDRTTGAGAIVFREFPEQLDNVDGFHDLHVPCRDVNRDASGIANATPHHCQ